MNPIPFIVAVFVGILGYLLGGLTPCLVAVAVWLGIVIIISMVTR